MSWAHRSSSLCMSDERPTRPFIDALVHILSNNNSFLSDSLPGIKGERTRQNMKWRPRYHEITSV